MYKIIRLPWVDSVTRHVSSKQPCGFYLNSLTLQTKIDIFSIEHLVFSANMLP